MELMEAITGRRSIRKFLDTPVKEEQLRQLLQAACHAPTGGNIQPWIFGVITDSALVKQIKVFSPGMLGNPPCLIACCTDRRLAYEKGGDLGRDTMAVMDVCLAAENMALRAAELGLGTCFIKSYNEAAVRRMLGLPEHVALDLLLMVGTPAAVPAMPKRKPLSDVTFLNRWGAPK